MVRLDPSSNMITDEEMAPARPHDDACYDCGKALRPHPDTPDLRWVCRGLPPLQDDNFCAECHHKRWPMVTEPAWTKPLQTAQAAINELVQIELAAGDKPHRYDRAAKLCRIALALTKTFGKRVGQVGRGMGGGAIRIRGYDEAGIEDIDMPEMINEDDMGPLPMPLGGVPIGGMNGDIGDLMRQLISAQKELWKPRKEKKIEVSPIFDLSQMLHTRAELKEQGFPTSALDAKITLALAEMEAPQMLEIAPATPAATPAPLAIDERRFLGPVAFAKRRIAEIVDASWTGVATPPSLDGEVSRVKFQPSADGPSYWQVWFGRRGTSWAVVPDDPDEFRELVAALDTPSGDAVPELPKEIP